MADDKLATIDELHRRVGRNVLLFQAIEQNLRFILPYVHPEGSAKGTEAMHAYQRASVDQKSLGQLIGEFKESASGSVDLIESGLSELLAARNELVHHFYRNERFSVLSADGVTAALAYLDGQHERALEWAEVFRAQSLALLLILMENNPELAAEYGEYRDRLIAQLPGSFETAPATKG